MIASESSHLSPLIRAISSAERRSNAWFASSSLQRTLAGSTGAGSRAVSRKRTFRDPSRSVGAEFPPRPRLVGPQNDQLRRRHRRRSRRIPVHHVIQTGQRVQKEVRLHPAVRRPYPRPFGSTLTQGGSHAFLQRGQLDGAVKV